LLLNTQKIGVGLCGGIDLILNCIDTETTLEMVEKPEKIKLCRLHQKGKRFNIERRISSLPAGRC
jgi:hypothetical protein